ncbi:hypothetical protein [Amycolatopsis sp. Hca4]|uniref:hypothetical protein n=1 Tax=Amycolatopsis sp. Hca4 TaxID=2742131 RepID=UPI0020CAA563|nr:hypothetical protein [Amycolatopsis sp. Hca4]
MTGSAVSSRPVDGEVRAVPPATLPQLFEAAVRAHPAAPRCSPTRRACSPSPS